MILQLQMTICAGAGILCGMTITTMLMVDAVKRQRQRRPLPDRFENWRVIESAKRQRIDATVQARRIEVKR